MLGLRITTSLTLLAIAATLVGPWPCLFEHMLIYISIYIYIYIYCIYIYIYIFFFLIILHIFCIFCIALRSDTLPCLSLRCECELRDPRDVAVARCRRYFLKQRNYYKANAERWGCLCPKRCPTLPLQSSHVTNDTPYTTFSNLAIQVSREVPFLSNSTSQQHLWKRKKHKHPIQEKQLWVLSWQLFSFSASGDADSRGADEFFSSFSVAGCSLEVRRDAKRLSKTNTKNSPGECRFQRCPGLGGQDRCRDSGDARGVEIWKDVFHKFAMFLIVSHSFYLFVWISDSFGEFLKYLDRWQCWRELVKASKHGDFGTGWPLWCSCHSFEDCCGRRCFSRHCTFQKGCPLSWIWIGHHLSLIQRGLQCQCFVLQEDQHLEGDLEGEGPSSDWNASGASNSMAFGCFFVVRRFRLVGLRCPTDLGHFGCWWIEPLAQHVLNVESSAVLKQRRSPQSQRACAAFHRRRDPNMFFTVAYVFRFHFLVALILS